MRSDIKKQLEANIDSIRNQCDTDVERTTAEAQEVNDKLETEKAGEATWNIYQSYIKAGFTEEQAWTLVQIVMSNATKRTLF